MNYAKNHIFYPSEKQVQAIKTSLQSNTEKTYSAPLSYDDWTEMYHTLDARAHIIHNFMNTLGGRVLEVGAEAGGLSRHLSTAKNIKLDAYEPDSAYHELLKLQASSAKIATKIPESDEYYDAVVSVAHQDRLTDLEQGAQGIEQLSSLLKKDGVLVLAVENILSLKHLDSNDTSLQSNVAIRSGWAMSKESLLARLKAAGIVDVSLYFPLPDRLFPVEVTSEDIVDSFDWAGKNYDLSPTYGRGQHNFEPAIISRSLSITKRTPLVFNDFIISGRRA